MFWCVKESLLETFHLCAKNLCLVERLIINNIHLYSIGKNVKHIWYFTLNSIFRPKAFITKNGGTETM